MLMNFNVYKYKDLQHFMQILNQCEAEGITDIRFVREQLHNHLYKPQKVRPVKVKNNKLNTCPECNTQMYPANGNVSGEFVFIDDRRVFVCPSCRYSGVEK